MAAGVATGEAEGATVNGLAVAAGATVGGGAAGTMAAGAAGDTCPHLGTGGGGATGGAIRIGGEPYRARIVLDQERQFVGGPPQNPLLVELQERLRSELGRGATFVVELPVECPETAHRAMPSLT